jgi:hypothetical protein
MNAEKIGICVATKDQGLVCWFRLNLVFTVYSLHDGCDFAIAEFREIFGDAYRNVEVVKKLSIN